MKYFYPRRIDDDINDGQDEEREQFHRQLKCIEDNALTVESKQEPFYDVWIYTMADGTQWIYTESIDYGIPYSLERAD